MNIFSTPNESSNLPPSREQLTAYEAPIVQNYLGTVDVSLPLLAELKSRIPVPAVNVAPQYAPKTVETIGSPAVGATVTDIEARRRQMVADAVQAELATGNILQDEPAGINHALLDEAHQAIDAAFRNEAA